MIACSTILCLHVYLMQLFCSCCMAFLQYSNDQWFFSPVCWPCFFQIHWHSWIKAMIIPSEPLINSSTLGDLLFDKDVIAAMIYSFGISGSSSASLFLQCFPLLLFYIFGIFFHLFLMFSDSFSIILSFYCFVRNFFLFRAVLHFSDKYLWDLVFYLSELRDKTIDSFVIHLLTRNFSLSSLCCNFLILFFWNPR